MSWRIALAAVFTCGLLLGAVGYAAVSSLVQSRSVGTIRAIGVEVYANEALNEVLSEISWGTLELGESRTYNAWIKNTGNDAQKLTMWTESWNPVAAQNSITLSWNYDSGWISAGEAVAVTFTLTVDAGISGVDSFSFDIYIKGVA